MPIRVERLRLTDDSRSFSPEDLNEIWAWLDSFDAQPPRPSDATPLVRSDLSFRRDRYVFRQRVYSIAKCSDGRELLGSVIAVAPPAGIAREEELRLVRN